MTDICHPHPPLHSNTLGQALIALASLPPASAPGQAKAEARSAACKLTPVMSTHTLPPYPLLSKELGEQGTTILQVTVAHDGRVSRAKVTQSSGFPRLDKAAASHVQQHYLWQPPACTPAGTIVKILWDLGRDA